MNTHETARPELCLEDLRREHLELAELQSALLKTLAEKSGPMPRVMSLLESIGERVTAHFRDEEAGIVRERTAKDPDHDSRCRQLCDEHRDLTLQLQRTLAIANRLDDVTSPAWWHDVEDAFREFSVTLTKHEHCEQALIEDILRCGDDAQQ